jgi:P4 family phage/plasmid primase-like protien
MTTTALNSPKDYAYYYRDKLDFSVFVLKTAPAEDRKEPAVRSTDPYFERKPTDEEMELWFKINPNYNLAISMGQVSQAIAFDVDGPNAVKRIESLIPEMSSTLREAFANTMKNKTGSGSEHVVLKIEGRIDDIARKQIWTDGKPHSQVLMLANKSYIVAAPSVHPNGKRYEWNGKDPQTITRQELNEFIRLVGPSMQSRPQSDNIVVPIRNDTPTTRTLSPEQMQELLSWIKPYYNPGSRNDIIFYLSGMMHKTGNFSLDTARRFIKLLCNSSCYPDEDLDKSLTVVDNTYRKPLDEINGKSGLHDLLVTSYEANSEYDNEQHHQRVETFSQICQIINGEPETPPIPPDNDDDNNDKNKSGKNLVHSGVGLLREKTVDDDTTRIISFLATEVMSRVALKSFFDTHEIIYWNARRKYYQFGGESIIDAEIENIIKEIGAPFTVRSYVKAEVQKCIADRNIINREEFDADPYTINLENCLLDIIALEQMEHTPEHLTMSKFPIVYDSAAECPRIERFLGEVIQDTHKLREVLKFLAYVLLKNCKYEKGLMLLGAGANGKSKLIALFEAFVGHDNCSHLSLHELEEDRFGRARLFGKALNTYADNKSQRLKETGNLKTVISGDTIEGQNKFKPRFSFRPRAKIAVSTNNPPETEDKTHAFYRRWLTISFERTFVVTDDINDPNRRDPDLEAKITAPGELSGLLNLALRYLPVLIKEGGFTEEPIDKVKKEYERKADHVSRYLQEYCIVDPSNKDYATKTSELYEHYVRVCKEILNIRATDILDENVLGSRLVEHGILKKRRRIRKGEGGMEYVYEPVTLKHKLYQEQSSVFGSIEQQQEPREDEQPAITSPPSLECPHCTLPGNNNIIFRTKDLRDYQLHFIFRHPELYSEEIGEEV